MVKRKRPNTVSIKCSSNYMFICVTCTILHKTRGQNEVIIFSIKLSVIVI